MRAEFEVMSA